ncbi:ctf8 [Colletotrichum higginsianum]|nr:ctf8 [Colletotrichum higginsianum]
MSSVKIHPPMKGPQPQRARCLRSSQLLLGSHCLRLQGTINLPHFNPDEDSDKSAPEVPIGKVVFPITTQKPKKKAARRHGYHPTQGRATTGKGGEVEEELEIAEIVKYKIMFGNRPEPVTTRTIS